MNTSSIGGGGTECPDLVERGIWGCKWLPYIIVAVPMAVMIVRAIVSAITFDEAYTYINYALPLCDKFSAAFIADLYNNCVLNNHWLNTFLIALVARISGVRYNEFIVRLPAIIFGVMYYLVIARCKEKDEINWAEFIMLCFSYYLNEFMGLARGYGMCTCIVFLALIMFKRYLKNSSFRQLWACCFLFILSAYANTVSLLIFFSAGAVAIAVLVRRGKLLQFIKASPRKIDACIVLLFVILYYHFRVSNVSKGLPVYATRDVNFIFYVREYLFLMTHYTKYPVPFLYVVAVGILVLFAVQVIVKRGRGCYFSIALMIHVVMLYAIAAIFRRGTFLQRLLIPSYPLVIMGGVEMMRNCYSAIKKYIPFLQRMIKPLTIVLLLLFFANFVHRIDYLHTYDWHKNYKIRTRVRRGESTPDGDGNPCWPFYKSQLDYLD